MIGEKIRDFEIQSELGSGGYGVVYRAHDHSVDRDVAIKVILPQYANQPEFVENFAAEARLVAGLEHPRIVPLYSYWRDERGAFLVMRFIRGGSLRGMLTKQGALPFNKVLRLIEQIAEALNVAHESGVVHRDLKPDNILIDERGNAYLTDFGIAKQLSEDNISATDSIKGTFAYLSPEQIQQTKVSPQTDIYALGIMLYEMLAGKHPLHGTPIGMMVLKHLHEPLPDLSDVRDDLNHNIDDIIQKATAKDPDERYATTLDMLNDLRGMVSEGVIAQSQPITPVKKRPASSEDRNRHTMLENVRKFWIEGVLENSLHHTAKIELGMKSESGAVDNPWNTLLRTPSGEEIFLEDNILKVFDRMNGKLLILGDPGGGKTTTLLTLARELLVRAESDDQHPMPVILNLSSWSEKHPPMKEWLIDELNGKYQVPRKVGTQWVEDDELLLLLDGLDEVSEDQRDACLVAINDYRGEHGFVDVVVCSRIKDYEALTGQLKLNGAIVIQPLNDGQILSYLETFGADVAIVRELITRDAQLRELAQSPLMLSIMILAYRGKTASNIPDFDEIEAQRNHLFEIYVDRMFERRLGDAYYSKSVTNHYLNRLAKQLQAHAQSVFYIEDMQPDWFEDPLNKSRYEAMIGFIIGFLNTVFGGIVMALAILVLTDQLSAYGIKPRLSYDIIFFICVLFGALYGVITGWANYREAKSSAIEPAETMKWSVNSIIPNVKERFWYVLSISVVTAILFGAGFGLIVETRAGIAMGVAGLLGAIQMFLHSSGFTTAGVDTKVRPNQGIWKSLHNTLQLTPAPPILLLGNMGIFLTLIYDVRVALITIGILTVPMILISLIPDKAVNPGSFVVIQHLVLRYFLERENQIPRNYARFLDHAVAHVLLRKVGGGYIFIHRYLLEYFANLKPER